MLRGPTAAIPFLSHIYTHFGGCGSAIENVLFGFFTYPSGRRCLDGGTRLNTEVADKVEIVQCTHVQFLGVPVI